MEAGVGRCDGVVEEGDGSTAGPRGRGTVKDVDDAVDRCGALHFNADVDGLIGSTGGGEVGGTKADDDVAIAVEFGLKIGLDRPAAEGPQINFPADDDRLRRRQGTNLLRRGLAWIPIIRRDGDPTVESTEAVVPILEEGISGGWTEEDISVGPDMDRGVLGPEEGEGERQVDAFGRVVEVRDA